MQEQPTGSISDARSELITQMRAVTISREYGSGGGEIASRLALHLNWQLIDHEMVVQLAQRLGVSVQEAAHYDEHAASFMEHLLASIRNVDPAMWMNATGTVRPEELYHRALHQVVTAAARERHVVIIGRGSQIILAERRDVLHVRVVAPLTQRIRYVMQREALNQEDARRRIQMKDRDRHRYLQTQYQRDNSDAHLYDLVCNTGVISLDHVVDLICQALELKSTHLGTPTGKLGPTAGAAEPYPTEPRDFRPPQDTQGR